MEWLSRIHLTWVTSAAVVGFVGSLTIALVNAISARRLERVKALRAYREKYAKDCLEDIKEKGAVARPSRIAVCGPAPMVRFPGNDSRFAR